jgi:hypothetical protein
MLPDEEKLGILPPENRFKANSANLRAAMVPVPKWTKGQANRVKGIVNGNANVSVNNARISTSS